MVFGNGSHQRLQVTSAEIYLSSNELQSSSQLELQPSSQLPAMVMSPAATVLNPVTVQDDQMEVGNTGEQTFSEATTKNGKNMSEERTSDATANNDSEMQVIDNQVLQINVR